LKNVPQIINQPDGSAIECFSSGDEFYNWVHDKDGYTIVKADNGFCYYADTNLQATEYRVGEVDPETLNLPKWIKIDQDEYINKKKTYLSNSESRTPTTGTVNNLNVFIRFADEPEFGQPFNFYDDPFNRSEGPSMLHYFDEVSYGALNAPTTHFPIPDGDVIISYQDQYPRSYYEPYNAQTNPDGYTNDSGQREHVLLRNAIEFIEDQVPTDLVIDADNDGNVDNVTFLVFGSPGAWADLLWPHRWVLYYEDARIHGKRVWDYNLNLATGGYFTVGTLCHEFNHSLGAPDLYHYYSDGPTACGGWDVMDASSNTPQYMGAFMKAKYGHWIEDTNGDGQKNEYDIPLLSDPGTYNINPLDQSTDYAYRIASPYTDNQYFVVEYRRKQGLYEIYTPGNDDGLLVYRINNFGTNGNADGPPDEVYIYRPNGDADTNGNLGLATFSQETGRDKINDQTNPSAFLYPNWTAPDCTDSDGCEGGLFLKNIGNPNETISFDYFPIFLNASFNSISNDSDGDGVLNPGEEATLNFSIENTSSDSFAYAITAHILENENFEVLSDDVFIEELHGDQISPQFSFDIKVNNGVSIGMIELELNIAATVYQEIIGDFDYDDTLVYDLEISMNQSGFPFETVDEVKSSPAVFDLDQNGDNEIIFGDSSGMFYILNHDLSIYNSYDVGEEIWGAPAIDDFNGDGNYEIAITSKNGFFYIFDYMGNMVYEYDTEQYLLGSPSIGTQSGDKRIIVSTYSNDGEIIKFSYTENTEISRFDVNKKIKKGVALYDFNGDGVSDYVYGTDSNTLEVAIYTASGYEISNIFEVGGKIQSAPAIIKFNDNEFLIVAGSKDDNLYAFNPILGTEQFVYETGGDVKSPSFFEHNEHGTVIVFGSNDGYLYMIDTNGNDVPGWPKYLEGQVEGSAAISDLDGDGLVDIIIGNSQGQLYAFNENGDLLVDFPVVIEFPYTSSPVMADLDNDGDLEILLGGSDGLYGYDFENQNGSIEGLWFMYRGNHKRTGVFESVSYLSSDLSEAPNQFNINSVYPNPFNPTTSISVDVPNNEQFKLSVYDIKGALVQEIFSGSKPVGSYQFNWDASAYSSGIYLVNISSYNYFKSHKIMLIK
jgi:M6 family metalloprotease-like protein